MPRFNRCARYVSAVFLTVVATAQADVLFPPDAVINVRDYGAIPGDDQDDTAAIQKAITENVGTGRTVYFPMGRYDISDTLVAKDKDGRWEAHLTLRGQLSERTVLRLRNQCPGFDNHATPKPVIMTGSHWQTGDSEDGGGNKAFRNNIRDLTIHTGIGNPGAIGIEWANSNQGTIRDVVIRNRDGIGITGIAMERRIPGPGYIRNVAIRGFDTGISVNDLQYGVTLEKISLQTAVTGIRLGQNLVYGMEVEAELNGVESHDPISMAVLLYSNINTGQFDAVKLRGHGLIRDDLNPKYRDTTVFTPGQQPRAAGRNSDDAYALLRIADAPVYWNDKPDQWAAVGPRRDGEPDDTAAIQRAFDAGKPVVYFPIKRTYFLGDTVTIRGKVRHVLGMGAEISLGAAEKPFSNREKPRPLFRINPVDGDDVTIEDCFFNAQYPGEVIFENNSPKPLIIRHCMGWVGSDNYRRSYQNTPASFGGKVYIEDCFLPGWRFEKQDVWARQFNPENMHGDGKIPQVANIGGNLWILGFKTEGPAPFIHTSAGGKTELLGAYNYISATHDAKVPEDAVPYIVEDGQASLTFVSDNFRQDSDYKVYIREIKNGKTVREVTREQMPPRKGDQGDRSFVMTNYRTK
jgi:hypothetical protein